MKALLLNVSLITFFSLSIVPISDDHSRVRLQPIEGETSSDYINGNYIDVRILL